MIVIYYLFNSKTFQFRITCANTTYLDTVIDILSTVTVFVTKIPLLVSLSLGCFTPTLYDNSLLLKGYGFDCVYPVTLHNSSYMIMFCSQKYCFIQLSDFISS